MGAGWTIFGVAVAWSGLAIAGPRFRHGTANAECGTAAK